MPVDVKSYLASMKSISSQTTSNIKSGTASQNDLKLQALLAQLIEALSYAKSMDFRQKTLNAPAIGSEDKTAREILEQMKSQEKLVKQLAEGQALSKEQGDKLTKAIDKFYEMAGATEINYKKFSENLKKFAEQDLPEAVKTRIANDSKDARLISKEQSSKENPVINTLKKIKYYIEDTAENTKQFRKKLFVTLDQFKEGLFDAFDKLGEEIASGDIISKLLKNLSGLGALGLVLQGFTKEGMFGIPTLVKQFMNLRALAKGGKLTETVVDMFKGIRMIFKQFKFLPKLISKFGLGKGLGAAAKGIGKGVAKGMGKNALKKIPVIGALLSIWFATSRWKQGDKAGALIEIASGVASLFPGIGTLVSIGLDLINIGRDTGFFKNMKEKVETKIPNLSENMLLSIPVVGQIFGLKKTFDLWKSGDKMGALKMATKSLASLMPGGAWLFDIFEKMASMTWDKSPKEKGGSNQKGGNLLSEAGSGDCRGSIAQFGAGDKVNLGDRLAQNAIAIGGHRTTSSGVCALKVGDALERTDPSIIKATGRGNAWTWINKLKGPGKKWFNYAGKAKSNKDLANLAPGSIAVWNRQSAHPYGHIEIADGRGHLISDFSRPANLNLYRSNPANIKPEIFTPKGVAVPRLSIGQEETSSSSDILGQDFNFESQENIATSDDAISAYTSFIDQIQNKITGISGAQMTSGKPMAAPVPIKSSVPASAPAQVQSQPSSMTTDVNDTALAILNSVLFK